MLEQSSAKPTPISKKMWTLFIVFGLFGQIAWAVENMYFNLFVYDTIAGSTKAVTIMVQTSGIMATVATLLAGALSDRVGNRKRFISWGYIIWGIVTLSFAFISTENTINIFGVSPDKTTNMFLLGNGTGSYAIAATLIIVIVMDCVMTFFGSSANDAAFNAWVTDNTDKTNRGTVEGILSTMPLLALLIVAGGFGLIVGSIGYPNMFIILGSFVTACGVLGLFVIKDSPKLVKNTEGNYIKNVFYGFRPLVVKRNPKLYIVLLAIGIYSIACQVFMPYLIIYMQKYLEFTIMEYSIVLGGIIAVAAVCVALLGKLSDKIGKGKMLVGAAAIFCIGLFGLFFVKDMSKGTLLALMGVIGFVMLIGYLMLMVLLNALVRDYMPEKDTGKLQGIRMFFYVLLPMFIGPAIGDAINQSFASSDPARYTYIDEATGAIANVPAPHIFLVAAIIGIFVFIPIFFIIKFMKEEKTPKNIMLTRFGKALLEDIQNSEGEVSEAAADEGENKAENSGEGSLAVKEGSQKVVPLPEYPRPQLVRDSFLNLNGKWKYAITEKGAFGGWEGDILVPFSPESLLSGVQRQVTPEDTLWYMREFEIPQGFLKDRALLNFGAVDCICEVKVNGIPVGGHTGGYTPFTLDVTDAVQTGNNKIEVTVTDPSDTSYHARGKQKINGHGIWYTPQSGIWQTVWLESVTADYVKDMTIIPDIDKNELSVKVESTAEVVEVKAYDNGKLVAEGRGKSEIVLKVENCELWSPENPKLYDLTVTAGADIVQSYFGMRKFSVGEDEKGTKRLMLNNKPYFHRGVLDQGYWSDGMLTPPSDEALVYDIEYMKAMGFNMIRKHIKIEPLRWYYHCDRMGMLVWQDMVNGGEDYSVWTVAVLPFISVERDDTKNRGFFGRRDEKGREEFEKDTRDTINYLKNSVSIAMWVPFNEGWGQFDSVRITEMIKEMDNTRTIDSVSGWHDQGKDTSDFKSLHIYFKPVSMPKDEKRCVLLSEFGGYSLKTEGHIFNLEKTFGYKVFKTKEELFDAYKKLVEEEVLPFIPEGLSATVYTQVSDVEEEINGFVTYDRAVEKFDRAAMKELNERQSY